MGQKPAKNPLSHAVFTEPSRQYSSNVSQAAIPAIGSTNVSPSAHHTPRYLLPLIRPPTLCSSMPATNAPRITVSHGRPPNGLADPLHRAHQGSNAALETGQETASETGWRLWRADTRGLECWMQGSGTHWLPHCMRRKAGTYSRMHQSKQSSPHAAAAPPSLPASLPPSIDPFCAPLSPHCAIDLHLRLNNEIPPNCLGQG